MFITVIVLFLSIKETPNLQNFFLSEILFVKPALQCLRMAKQKITVVHDRNTAVLSDNQKILTAPAIVNSFTRAPTLSAASECPVSCKNG